MKVATTLKLSMCLWGFVSFSLNSWAGEYPFGFEWGSAVSAHQTEGLTPGAETSDWYKLEHPKKGKPSVIANGDTADIGTDFWNRYPEDLALAKKMGLTSLRTSLAWEKIEPSEGQFNEQAIEHYRDFLKEMHRVGLKPIIALHHFTNPMWFVKKGNWLANSAPQDFLKYARYVVEHLGDLCDTWITFNEPMIDATMGYLSGEYPPRMKSPHAAFDAAFQFVRAHRMVTAMIHEVQGPSPDARGADGRLKGVGIANSWALLSPKNKWNPFDRWITKFVAEANNWSFMRAVLTGELRIPFPIFTSLALDRKQLPKEDLEEFKPSSHIDWIGVNYYSCYLIGFGFPNFQAIWTTPRGAKMGDNGWAICPEGLETIIRQAAHEFPGIPLVVTENGLADEKDQYRPQFIKKHLRALDRAIKGSDAGGPIDLRGYYHWSLTDNFEWLFGYKYRFGLFEVDYSQNLKRIPRQSVTVYSEEIEKRSRY